MRESTLKMPKKKTDRMIATLEDKAESFKKKHISLNYEISILRNVLNCTSMHFSSVNYRSTNVFTRTTVVKQNYDKYYFFQLPHSLNEMHADKLSSKV